MKSCKRCGETPELHSSFTQYGMAIVYCRKCHYMGKEATAKTEEEARTKAEQYWDEEQDS